ncbi:MAG: hypothetical protein ABIK62_01845 [candidate division WOR-3 bacterium]
MDRFGQRQDVVKTFLLYGKDNPMDGAVLDVLLRKARTIYTRLGVTVPVPVNSVKVMEAIGAYLFSRGRTEQLRLFEDLPEVRELQVEWDRSEEREKASRTRFAQHAIHPNEVAQEIEATDQVLGDETAVQEFVVAALQRLGASVVNKGRVWRLIPDTLKNDHGLLYEKLKPFTGQDFVFSYPIPEGARAIGRNHPVTAALADYLLDAGLDETRSRPIAARCGAIRTKAVSERTALLLLRLRYRLLEPGRPELLAEELLVSGFVLVEGPKTWLVPEDALRLLTTTTPSVNITQAERERSVAEALAAVRADKAALELLAQERAEALKTAHRRVRRITREGRIGVLPHLPPDVLGIYVLVPDPAGTRR